ncbi:MAG: cation diffusion facilitator family transporter [Pseudoflavonifractor sp.]|nr:cation diffusion facilitator family transporter [Pseudoflavonifractor sp.]
MTEFLLRKCVKDYQDVKNPAVRERYGTLSGAVGIFLNLMISLGKFAAGVITSSVAVTADAFNNLSDAASSLVTLVGFRLAGQKADDDHPFGHGRIEYLAGLAVSVAILLVGLELAKSAVGKILHPETVLFSPLSAGILSASILVKLWMYFFNRDLSRRIESAAMAATAADSLSDCVATGAVLLGLVVGHFAKVSIDGWVGVLVAAFVFKTGWGAAKDTISPLLGQAPDPALVAGIRETVLIHPEVSGVHDLIVHDYGPGHVMASLHAEVSVDADMATTHDVIDNIERELGSKYHIMATIHMDPIATDDSLVNARKAEMLELARQIDPTITLHDFRMTEGPTHTNLIFDLVVPRKCPLSDGEVRQEMARRALERNARYLTVIQIDHSYTE